MIPVKIRRRSRRRRVSATAESAPSEPRTSPASLAPRRAIARSIKSASPVAARIVTAAVIESRWSLQKPAATGRMAAGMTMEATRVGCVLLDCMGTLVALKPPAPVLARELEIDEETAERAFRAEVAYYLEHQLEGSDTAALADLRARCASVVAEVAGVEPERALVALMRSLEFETFEDVRPALVDLRTKGVQLVVVSNWDCSLGETLERVGLGDLFDAVVTSAEVGAAKPDAR